MVDDADDPELAAATRAIKRGSGHAYLYVALMCLVLMLLSPLFNRFLEEFQGVVIAPVDNGEVTIMRHDSIIVTRSMGDAAAELELGDFVRKDRATWNPVEIAQDELTNLPKISEPEKQPPVALPRFFEQYVFGWKATITAIHIQKLPTTGEVGEPREKVTMVLLFDEGGTDERPIPFDLGGKVEVGSRLEKPVRAWLPHVIPSQ